MLDALTRVPRFDTAVMFLDKKDKDGASFANLLVSSHRQPRHCLLQRCALFLKLHAQVAVTVLPSIDWLQNTQFDAFYSSSFDAKPMEDWDRSITSANRRYNTLQHFDHIAIKHSAVARGHCAMAHEGGTRISLARHVLGPARLHSYREDCWLKYVT